MKRPWHTWAAFAACASLLLAAMAWISWTAVGLEDAREAARREAEREERVRLALWRMDSVLAPMIAQEGGRPYFFYTAFYSPDQLFVCSPKTLEAPEVLLASPLLTETPPHVLLYFQYGPNGKLTSPQIPEERLQKTASDGGCLDSGTLAGSTGRLEKFRQLATREALAASLPAAGPARQWTAPPARGEEGGEQNLRAQTAQAESVQGVLNDSELAARARVYDQVSAQNKVVANRPVLSKDVSLGLMQPLWIGEELVLARRASVRGTELIQGCWLDWPEVKKAVLAGVKDLLPEADVAPLRERPEGGTSRVLVSLPAVLSPGFVAEAAGPGFSPVRFSLLIAWSCILAAAFSVAALLFGVLKLSERRGAFVSAVTHELRTPLTTFRMYTEMLSKDMVSGEEARGQYVQTLSREADRLGHLVENVLAYARLERGGPTGRAEVLTLGDIIERVRGRLAGRAEQAEMELAVDGAEADLAARVMADPVGVEQVLFNLVDNACKYAASAEDRRIHLDIDARREEDSARIRVWDHGPGIPRDVLRRLFRPFSKSAREAAHSAPGVGLGLALSRRVAREMGGDLRHESAPGGGACFVLELPAG